MLRHFKLEYFLMTNSSAFILTEIVFLNGFYDVLQVGPLTNHDKVCLICCMVPRILRYIYYSLSLAFGNSFFEEKLKFLNYGVGLISFGVAIYILASFSKDKENLLVSNWIKIEIAALFLEPSVLIILSFLKPKDKKEMKHRVWSEEKDDYVWEKFSVEPSTYGTLIKGEDADD
jgi:hypothetical protein